MKTKKGNAYEAASKCGEGRYIKVNMSGVAEMLSIHIENTFTGELSYENGRLRTTKSDPGGHGFGIRSMEWIVKRYDGTISSGAKGGIFSQDILLPLPLTRDKEEI
ncbi:MAG: ATP-binding protein [Oscillospiraceae bacterium]|nr:ATP-binding protein [Oscillospiraceae bacterium]